MTHKITKFGSVTWREDGVIELDGWDMEGPASYPALVNGKTVPVYTFDQLVPLIMKALQEALDKDREEREKSYEWHPTS